MPTTCQTNRRQTLRNQGYHHSSTGSTAVHNVRIWNLPDRRRNCGTWRLSRHLTLSISSKSVDKFLHDHSWLLPGQSLCQDGRVKCPKCAANMTSSGRSGGSSRNPSLTDDGASVPDPSESGTVGLTGSTPLNKKVNCLAISSRTLFKTAQGSDLRDNRHVCQFCHRGPMMPMTIADCETVARRATNFHSQFPNFRTPVPKLATAKTCFGMVSWFWNNS